ncbi:MAG: DNA cytosine methyltransferase, partial [Patescibacteria group bacterium]|nr:DNA cytosine methyltransferase [Patescibacteria group bacterium]
MITPQFILPIHHELIVDLFAGGGGASTGIEQALGRHVDVAINHDPEAVSLHQANHPQTQHFVSDVFEVDPVAVCAGRPVGLLWASPDCKHFSKAKGSKPVSKKIRSLAWVVVKWAKAVQPRVICLENVEEFQTWGPLAEDGRPCPKRKGRTFAIWKKQLENLGYAVEHRELRACNYGAPTIRKRLFLVARRDGQPIIWPAQTHAKPDPRGKVPKGLKPWRTAAECIDWSIPARSIFERKRDLADATCRRIARGLMRYVVNSPNPFIVGCGGRAGQSPERSISQPFQTITAKADACIAVPYLTEHANASSGRVFSAQEPLRTQVAQIKGGHFALVSAFLAKHYTGVVGSDLADPVATVTSVDHHSLVTSHMVKLRGQNTGSRADEPLHTISAQGTHHAEVRAFLIKYYSEGGQDQDCRDPMHTLPTKDRIGLVMV